MQSSPKFSVAIVGGGIGGLSLALGLLDLGNIDVQIYESAPKFSEVGLGVNVSPNAQRALSMISPNALEAYSKEATPNMWQSHAQVFTTAVAGFKDEDENRVIIRLENETGQRSVHRANFLENLVQHIPKDRAHFNKRLVGIDQYQWAEKVTMRFQDGTTAQADCVVGADGIHSRIRKELFGEESSWVNPRYTGTACFRALIPMAQASAALGDEYAQNSHLMCGPKAAIFSYPVKHGEALNIIIMDFDHPEWKAEKWVVPTDRKELEGILKGWGKTAHAIIDLMDSNDLTAWAMHDHPFTPFYNSSRVCIMGDAAHATTPFQGQGAGQAIEDALTLKAVLDAANSRDDIRFAFHAYDMARRARGDKVVSTSRHEGRVYGFMAPRIGSDLEKLEKEMEVSYQWMWKRDLQNQNEQAVKLMKEAMGI